MEYVTPISKRALLIIDLVEAARVTDDWDGIDILLDRIAEAADELTAW